MKKYTALIGGVALASAVGVAQAEEVPEILGGVDGYQPMTSQEMGDVQGEFALALGSSNNSAVGVIAALTVSYTSNHTANIPLIFGGGAAASSYSAGASFSW